MKTVPFRGETERITKMMWRTSYATASRCVTTVPFSWRDGQNHQMMWPPAMQQHPGASLRFHFVTDRITTCTYKILRPVSHPPNVHSFVGTARPSGAVPPAEKSSKFYVSPDNPHTHTYTPFYTQSRLRTDAFTHRFVYTQTLLHTLAQKQLIELLMWNASYVQKHFS